MPCLYENTGLIEGMTVVRGAECPLTKEKAYKYLTTVWHLFINIVTGLNVIFIVTIQLWSLTKELCWTILEPLLPIYGNVWCDMFTKF